MARPALASARSRREPIRSLTPSGDRASAERRSSSSAACTIKAALPSRRCRAVTGAARQLIEEELEVREFVPTIQKIIAVSSFSTPSTWDVETDRGPARLVLKAEEDIRRLGGRTRLLIAGGDGLQFRVKDTTALDKHSRRLLERFL
eukprot:gene44750-biopygen30769